jgi:hypothetical protein
VSSTGSGVYSVERSKSRIFRDRARKLLEIVDAARGLRNYDGMASAGVQAAISLADTYTVAKLQQRSRGRDHLEVVKLIRRCGGDEATEVAALVQRIVNRKTDVQYGDRPVRPRDAEEIDEEVHRLAKLVFDAVA